LLKIRQDAKGNWKAQRIAHTKLTAAALARSGSSHVDNVYQQSIAKLWHPCIGADRNDPLLARTGRHQCNNGYQRSVA